MNTIKFKKVTLLLLFFLCYFACLQAQRSWSKIGIDIISDWSYEKLGFSVSLSSDGSMVAIGTPYNDDSDSYAGQVRVYKNISGTWTQQGGNINGAAAGDELGRLVSLSSDGSTVAIGAFGRYAVLRVYKNISGTWIQLGEDINNGAVYDELGRSVSLSLSSDGNTIAIGAPSKDDRGIYTSRVRMYSLCTNPTAYSVTGGGAFCAGGIGVAVGLSNSERGVMYQLKNGAGDVGAAVSGTGAGISFGNQTNTGTYTVVATRTIDGCTATMTGSATVNINNPTAYSVIGSGAYCAGGTGVPVGLDNSERGVTYQLKNGATDVGAAVSGTGRTISFGYQTDAGTYIVVATHEGGCTATMTGTAKVSINSILSPSLATTNGLCLGANDLTLSGASEATQIQWQLGNRTVATIVRVGTTVAGGKVGTASPSGVFADASGNIFVADANNHRVQKWASGDSTGTTVAGGNGQGSKANQLYYPRDVFVDDSSNIFVADSWNNRIQKWAPGARIGTTVAGGNGDDSADNQLNQPVGVFVDVFDNIFVADLWNHRIQKWASGASTGTTVAGGKGTGRAANQLSSPLGVFVDASGNIFVADAGNNRIQKWDSIKATFTPTAAGTYTAITTAPSGCISTSNTLSILPTPTAYSVTGGSISVGGTGSVGLSNSEIGVTYQLKKNGTTVGTAVAGTGAPISFGNQTAGTYTVVATNATTGCTAMMSSK